jgi:hypothetical protein
MVFVGNGFVRLMVWSNCAFLILNWVERLSR